MSQPGECWGEPPPSCSWESLHARLPFLLGQDRGVRRFPTRGTCQLALTLKEMTLDYAVLTTVCRDDFLIRARESPRASPRSKGESN